MEDLDSQFKDTIDEHEKLKILFGKIQNIISKGMESPAKEIQKEASRIFRAINLLYNEELLKIEYKQSEIMEKGRKGG